MFGTVANGTLPGRKYICSPPKSNVSALGATLIGLLKNWPVKNWPVIFGLLFGCDVKFSVF